MTYYTLRRQRKQPRLALALTLITDFPAELAHCRQGPSEITPISA
jgi:hypothetical protein